MVFWFHVPKRRPRGLHRRKRLHFWHHSREWLWPSMGVMPMLRWMELKIKRSRGTAYKAAMGAAVGVGVCFTPFFGFHVLLIFIFTRLLRASFLVGFVVSFVGNPWTFPVITLWTYELGHFLLSSKTAKPALTEAPRWKDVFSNIPYFWESYIWPMTVGGLPTGIVVGVIVFFTLRGNIRRYLMYRIQRIRAARQRHHEQQEKLRVAKLAEKIVEKGSIAKNKVRNILHKEGGEQK